VRSLCRAIVFVVRTLQLCGRGTPLCTTPIDFRFANQVKQRLLREVLNYWCHVTT
jgi:hypothetical protein